MRLSRRGQIEPFHVMEVMKRAGVRDRSHGDVIHLEVGQPSTAAPRTVREAAAELAGDRRLGYTDALGIPDLRAVISEHYRRGGHAVEPEQIVVTVGASGGFVLVLLAAFDAGARVGITEPGYAAYRNIVEALDLELVGVRVGPESRWVPTASALRSVGDMDGFVVASPSNPTGTALSTDEMAVVVDHCRDVDALLISDEIYHGISFGAAVSSALDHTDDAVIIQSFSKYFSMTGWRLGWLVAPPESVPTLERLAQNLFISPPTLSQLAALRVLDSYDELDDNVSRFAESRDLLIEALDRWELPYAPPDGAFYFWVDISGLDEPAVALCDRWLTEVGIAVTPGIDFDPERGESFVRISYSESPADIAEAIARLDAWFGGS